MAINYRGTNPQDVSNTSVRLEPVTSYDYSAYDSSSGEGVVENTTYWLVPDNFEYSSSVEFDKAGGGLYSASYFLVRPISITGSFYGDFNGTASYTSYALSASYAPLSIDTSSFYVSSPGNILFVNRYLLIAKGDGNIDTIDLSTLEAASASYASYALTASYALSGGSGGSTFPYTGSAVITGSLVVTGSLIVTGSTQGNVTALSISSATASLDLAVGSFFTLQLVSGSNTHINPSNIQPGLTATLLLSTTGSATVSFPSTIKTGSAYVPTTTTGKDVLTFISFDATNLYLAAVKNLG